MYLSFFLFAPIHVQCITCLPVPAGSEDDIGAHGTGVIHDGQIPCGGCKLIRGSLHEQQVV